MDILRKLWGASIPLSLNQPDGDGNAGNASSGANDERDDDAPPEERKTAQDEAIEDAAAEAEGGPEAQREDEEDIFPAMGAGAAHPLRPVRQFLGEHDQESGTEKQTMRLEIPTRTIIKVVLTLLVIWLVLKVVSIFLLLLLAVLLCLALLPLVRRMESQGLGRGGAASAVFASMLIILAGFLWLVVPQVTDQTQNLIDSAPDYLDNFSSVLDRYPNLRDRIDGYLGIDRKTAIEQAANETTRGGGDQQSPVDAQAVTSSATMVISYTTAILGTLANAFFVLVLAFYLLIEGERTWRYFARYMTPTVRYRFERLAPELTNVVSGYVIGQAIISVTFGIFTYIVLWTLGVPQPLLLALVSAILDAIPIVGVPVATVGAMAIGLSVSWQTSLIILGAFVIYQQIENYVLLPRVYGNTLQVTSLSILVGVLVGGQLMGVLGIVLSLPLTAAIPVIERVWREVIPPEIEAMEQRGVMGPPRPENVRAQYQRVHKLPES